METNKAADKLGDQKVKNMAIQGDDERDPEVGGAETTEQTDIIIDNLAEADNSNNNNTGTETTPTNDDEATTQKPWRAFITFMIGMCFIQGILMASRERCDLVCGHNTNPINDVICTLARFIHKPKRDPCQGHEAPTEEILPVPLKEQFGPPWHGEWERYIKAPKDKSHILPERIYKVRGNVSTSGALGSRILVAGEEFDDVTGQGRGDGILLGMGGSLTVAFRENIGGRICLDIDSIGSGSVKEGVVTVSLAYTESPWYAGPIPDATGDRQDRDLPLKLNLKGGKTGKVCVGKDFIRGSFKYFTISVPVSWAPEEKARPDRHWLRIKSLWTVCTAYPAIKDGRNLTGYFYSSSDLLNRIWYAGAWTLQISTIDPQEGSSLIDYNRIVDGNHSPQGSWYSNFTISNGTSVTTDGAKRDRVVWPGDMFIAIPGIAVSTKDTLSVRNALDVLYDHQYGDGSLPYAGPPMGFHGEFSDTYHLHTLLGTYNYVLYSGDLAYLRSRWTQYLRALNVSIAKVDSMGLLHVSSVSDWLRPGLTGHNLEASAILYTALSKSIVLATWLSEAESTNKATTTTYQNLISSWQTTQKKIETGISRLYCPTTGLFSDNIGLRSCKERYHIDPQDGNSWVLISGLDLSESNLPFSDPKSPNRSLYPLPAGVPSALNISSNLVNRWTKFGAPAVEFPNVISPFASGFELLAHCASGNVSAAVELMLLEWGYLLDGPGFTNSTLAEGFRVDGHMQYPAYPSAARNSHAHGWSSGPTSVLINHVIGVTLKKYGGLELEINSRLPGWLKFVRGGFEIGEGDKGGWVEVLVWRVKEWVPSSQANTEKDFEDEKHGDSEEGVAGATVGQTQKEKGQKQKPLLLEQLGSRKNGERYRSGAASGVGDSKGQKMKKTAGSGIIISVTIPEQTGDGFIRFGGLFDDLWEDEMRKGHRPAVPSSVGGDASAQRKFDGLKVGIRSEFGPPVSRQGNEKRRSASYWLRWAREEVTSASTSIATGDESGSESDQSRLMERQYFDAQSGKLYRAWPEVVRLPKTPTPQHGEPEADLFRAPVEIDYCKGKTGAEGEYQSIVLRFDEDYVPLEMDTSRPPGVVDWAAMEENFRTPVYDGWSVDQLKRGPEEGDDELFEKAMKSGIGMDGDFEYLD